MRWNTLVLVGILATFFTTQSATAQKLKQFNIEARAEKEWLLLQQMLERIYPKLRPDQQAVIDRGLFFVVSYWGEEEGPEGITWQYHGFGPEEDREYRYDRELYPQGTIKISITLRSLAIEELANTVPDPIVSRVLQEVRSRNLIVHEVQHVLQIMRRPIRPLIRPEDCPGGLCDPEHLEDSRRKMLYEFEALRRDFKEARGPIEKKDLEYTAKWLEGHPEVLVPGLRNLPRRLRGWDDTEKAISEERLFLYSAGWRAAVLARYYIQNNKFPSKKAREEAERLLAYNKAHKGLLIKTYPYLSEVFRVLERGLTPKTQ